MSQAPRYVFLDLETTGLDSLSDVILEIGMIACDRDLNTLGTFGKVINWPEIRYDTVTGAYEPPFGVHKTVVEMHNNSGLWEDSYRSTNNIVDAFNDASFWLGELMGTYIRESGDHEPGRMRMCGNTIGFDRAFLLTYVPQFLDIFHYRSIDVSSHRELYEDWVMGEHEDFYPMPVGNDLHRAVPDCLDSINKLKFFKKTLYDA